MLPSYRTIFGLYPQKTQKIFKKYHPQKKINKKNHPQKVSKNVSKKVYLLTYGNAKSLFEKENRIIILLYYWR